MSQIVLIDTDTLRLMLKEAVNAALQQAFPYPSQTVTEPGKKVFTRNEVAEIIQCTPNTVTKFIKQGRLAANCFNGQYRINEKELNRFIENKQR